jgi:hypothetical protein
MSTSDKPALPRVRNSFSAVMVQVGTLYRTVLAACGGVPDSAREPAGAERRRERRVETAQQATVRSIAGDRDWPASIRDFSPGGLCLGLQTQFAVGETVIVEWNHGFLVGTVRHTRPCREGWITGLQLEAMRSHEVLIAEMTKSERQSRLQRLRAPGASEGN